jgi:serine/threonine-protein kinase
MTAAADRHLLFGLLALQNGLIDQVQLVAAFQAWTRDKSKSLADHLEARGDLTGAKRTLLELLAEVHLEAHGGDVEKSLAAVPANRSTRASLVDLGEPEIEATLARFALAKNSQATEIDGDDDDDPDRTAGLSLGAATSDGQRFRILRPHAHGGLGAVFVALDAELNREVALKHILDEHADDPVSRQRFLVEAEITGGLEHPGIVPVYGLGSYGDGRPYYAMRFIKGDSLKEAIASFHADESLKTDPGRRSLALRKLLRRFTDICNAIDYAHSRGVLHRDLKPGNIIVGKHGETLVVDWGLAKATGRSDPSASERTLVPSSASGSAETLPGSALGTPAYMSPEQACGALDRLGPRSDVYSLGATLYCLLAGRAPVEGGEIGEQLRRVRRGDFTRPRLLDRSIDPALEAVCLKAMATEPEGCYSSCCALAEDIERWMADEPVSAWREPWTRNLLRWLTRHRTSVTGAAAAALAALVGLGAVAAVQMRANAELTRSKAAVQARYDLAVEAIKTFHTGVSEDFLLKQDQFRELRDPLLKSAADFYGKLGALLCKETHVASRQALVRSNFELAQLTGMIGRKEEALKAHRAVLAAREALAAQAGAGMVATVDVGRSLSAIAGLLGETGKADEALATYRRSESLLKDLARADLSARAVLAVCRSRLGWLLANTGNTAEALAALRQARADQEAAVAAAGAPGAARRELADTVAKIGGVLSDTGDQPGAEVEYRAGMSIYQTLADDNPTVTGYRDGLAANHHSLGMLLFQMGRPEKAEAEYREALEILRRLAEDYPTVTEIRTNLAASYNSLGILLMQTGRPAEGEAEHHRAQTVWQKLADDHPSVTEFRSRLAGSHHNLAMALEGTGKPMTELEAEYRLAIAISRKVTEENPTVTMPRVFLANHHYHLGMTLFLMGKPSEAEAELRQALAILLKLVEDNPKVPSFLVVATGFEAGLSAVLCCLGRAS